MDTVPTGPLFAITGFGFGYVISLRFGWFKGVLFVSVVCGMLLLTACGGGDQVGLEASGPADHACPSDPLTFIGPMQAECVHAVRGVSGHRAQGGA